MERMLFLRIPMVASHSYIMYLNEDVLVCNNTHELKVTVGEVTCGVVKRDQPGFDVYIDPMPHLHINKIACGVHLHVTPNPKKSRVIA